MISETEAGEFASGSIDLIWINGENFKTMKNAGLLFCGYWDIMPSMANVNQEAGTNAYDFGTPVDGCEVPWNQAQSAVFYNSALLPEPPVDMDALLAHACANPGTFTYPAPPDFTGSVFVRHVFYNEANKDPARWLRGHGRDPLRPGALRPGGDRYVADPQFGRAVPVAWWGDLPG